jgi:DNA-binding transcriptional MerR regulator
MSEQIKFTEEEIQDIRQVQSNYQAIGLELVQIKLALANTKNQLESLELEEKALTERISEVNTRERQIAKQLEDKYGKGEIDLESGVFTPNS